MIHSLIHSADATQNDAVWMAARRISLQDLKEKYPQLSDDLLNREVSEEHLEEAARTIADHEILGTALGLNSAGDGQGEIQRLKMLKRWKQIFAWKATYRVLIEALLKWNRADYARSISVLLTQTLKETPDHAQSFEGRGGERDRKIQEMEELIQQLRQENQGREREVRERERAKEGEIREREEDIEHLRSPLPHNEAEVRERGIEFVSRGGDMECCQYRLHQAVNGSRDRKEHLHSQVQQRGAAVTGREREREVRADVVRRQYQLQQREREVEGREWEEEIKHLRCQLQQKEREFREQEIELKEMREKNVSLWMTILQWEKAKEDEIREKVQLETQRLFKVIQEKDQAITYHLQQKKPEEQIQQLRQENQEREREVREKEREIKNLQSQLQQKEGEVRERERVIEHLQGQLQQTEEEARERKRKENQQSALSYTCLVSGPGLHSATANHPTHVIVEVSDSSGRPCSLQQNVTAQLVLQSTSQATPTPQATPTSGGRWPWSKKTLPSSDQPPAIDAAVAVISPSRYEVSYTAVRRGQHKLHVRVNGSDVNGSPFTLTVYPDPTQLGSPVRAVTDLNMPYGIVFNSRGEMVVTECHGHRVSVFDIRGQKVRTFGSHGDRPEQMRYPAGIAVDGMDNVYVSSKHKLQKLTSSGELIKCVGQRGSKEGEFSVPHGVTLHDNQVYVCDRNSHRIQVFDLDLNFIRSIGSHGEGGGELQWPQDVAFDTAGNMYVTEFGNDRVQVMDSSGHFIRVFGQEGEGKLSMPTALHIADKYVYVFDCGQHRIAVYQTSGHFVTSFGRYGPGEGELHYPYCITSCANGFIHVCDRSNNRVQVF